MAERRTPGKKVAVYHDNDTGDNIDIKLLPDGRFSAVAFNSTFVHAEKKELDKLLAEACHLNRSLEWQRVVEIRVNMMYRERTGSRTYSGVVQQHDDTITDAGVGLTAERYYVARRVDGKWLCYRGEEEAPARMLSMSKDWGMLSEKGTIPWSGKSWSNFGPGDTYRHVVYYSDELWAGLLKLQEALIVLQGRLNALIGSAEGRDRILSVGAELLRLALPSASEID